MKSFAFFQSKSLIMIISISQRKTVLIRWRINNCTGDILILEGYVLFDAYHRENPTRNISKESENPRIPVPIICLIFTD